MEIQPPLLILLPQPAAQDSRAVRSASPVKWPDLNRRGQATLNTDEVGGVRRQVRGKSAKNKRLFDSNHVAFLSRNHAARKHAVTHARIMGNERPTRTEHRDPGGWYRVTKSKFALFFVANCGKYKRADAFKIEMRSTMSHVCPKKAETRPAKQNIR